jgi:hypothetical protein
MTGLGGEVTAALAEPEKMDIRIIDAINILKTELDWIFFILSPQKEQHFNL